MPTETNSYAFCADYSNIAVCLFAIQTSEHNGLFAADPEVLKLLRLFEKDVLRKLYLRTLRTLKGLEVSTAPTGKYIGGDFGDRDFSSKDFFTGYWVTDPQGAEDNSDYFSGDFEDEDFTYLDFFVGYLDVTNTGYSSVFQTILNIFGELCRRSAELSDADKYALDAALIPVLDAFQNLQNYLISAGLNPCDATALSFLNNTPGVYLQAAGSTGTDGIAQGLHLRWSLTGELGTNHLPKGSHNNTSTSLTGFNQPNDYIQISRAPYVNQARVTVDFEQQRPIIDFVSRQWTYVTSQTVNGLQVTNRVRLRFTDTLLYDQLAGIIDPGTSYFNFIQQYKGLMELEVVNKSSFLIGFDFRKTDATASAILKIEGLCQLGAEEDAVTIRKTLVLNAADTASVAEMTGDNIARVQIKRFASGYLHGFYFETYHDFLSTRSTTDWTTVGTNFALSLTDTQVFERLESDNYKIDNLWPQYNNGTLVRSANYKDKWAVSYPNEPSLKTVVTTYLDLSDTDPRAEDIIKDDDAGTEIPGLLISYLDILNLQSLDYHMARMLGLGFIDTPAGAVITDQFIYKLTYTNKKTLAGSEIVNYSYLSLPISASNQLLPQKPAIRPLTYSLPVNDQEVNKMFNNQGYTAMDNIRVVNIGRELFVDELLNVDFFASADSADINIFEHPKPVLYGVEYRPASQAAYVKPEITVDKSIGKQYNAYDIDYPATGIAETIPLPDNETSLYIHFERQTGIHAYAIYGISWFARASVVSDEVITDATIFPVNNSLIPPTDVAVQYIQYEESLVFTTSVEQAWLQGRLETFPGQDVSFTRVTFGWLDIADISHLQVSSVADLLTVARPDTMKTFFKPGLPMEITGIIRDLVPVTGSDTQLLLYTGSYATLDGSIISPAIDPSDFFRFKDSLLSAPDGQYRVVQVTAGTDWPIITIEKALELTAVNTEDELGIYGTKKTYSLPDIGSRFSVIENLSEEANWEPVAEHVSLVSFADANHPVIESSADTEGNITQYWIGGITSNAVVTPLFTSANSPDDMPGYYQVVFDATGLLAPHPQINLPFDAAHPDQNPPAILHAAHVEWYKGWVRMAMADGSTDKKLLQVVSIDQTTPHLTIYLYDAGYLNASIETSANSTDLIPVNFHPGYKVYLFSEPSPEHVFNQDNIFPAEDANDKKTLLGLQTADTRNNFVSQVSMPAVLLARRIEDPAQFDAPDAQILKVRPDATGKAAFTFNVHIKPAANGTLRKPFGFTFYRTTEEEVLYALYAPETVTSILAGLAALTTDLSYNQRYLELVNLVFDPQNAAHFNVFDALPAPYGFPVPDKAGLALATDDQLVKSQLYYNAIIGTLLPLTEQTPVLDFVKAGTQTENKLPVIKDIDGNLLSASSPDFNPFPMIRKYTKADVPNTTYIRFTDYLLNGSSRSLYFYAGTEMTNQLIPGLLSPFAGPVTILHTAASAAPVIRKFTLLLPAYPVDQVAVVFQIAPMSPQDQISKIRVYRTTDPLKAGVLQLMDSYFDVDIEEGTLDGYEITDSFTDSTAPVGQQIYYNLVGIRTIINEFEVPEEVFSQASAVVTLNLIDTTNPQAPGLTYTATTNTLSWQPTVNNGTYFLYQQNSKGNWARIYTVQPPDTTTAMAYVIPQPLVLLDDDGNKIYYRFKVQAQNSSGLLNLVENELTV